MPGGAGFAQRSTPQPAMAARISRAHPPSARLSRRARSGLDDLGVVDAGVSAGIAGVDDERAVRNDETVVDAVVIGADERRIRLAERRRRQRHRAPAREFRMLARARHLRYEGIVKRDMRALRLEDLHDLEGGALAQIVDILLVGDAENEDSRTFEALAEARVERAREIVDDIARHCRVDLAGELDETRRYVVFARLPGEIEGIDGNAVPAEARTRIERHEAEGLGGGRLDYLPDIDAHGVVDHLEFVHERDVDGAENVLGELHRLGRLGRRHGDGPGDELIVKRGDEA